MPGTQELRFRILNASQDGQPHHRVSVHMRTFSIMVMWLWGVLAFDVPRIIRGIFSLVRMAQRSLQLSVRFRRLATTREIK